MSRGTYTVAFDEQSFTTALGDYDFFELTPASNKPIEIVGLDISQKSQTGDANEEMIAYAIMRGNTTTGNGTSTTARLLDPNDGAASFTAKVCSSTPASAGTPVALQYGCFNLRAGLQIFYPELCRPKGTNADLLCVRLLTALGHNETFSGTVWVREV